MKKIVCLMLTLTMLGLLLTACGNTGKDKKMDDSTAESSQSETTTGEEKVITGTINKIDTYLVLLTEDGSYYPMELGEGVVLDDFAEGDSVKVTYTGNLEAEEEIPVITSIVKTE